MDTCDFEFRDACNDLDIRDFTYSQDLAVSLARKKTIFIGATSWENIPLVVALKKIGADFWVVMNHIDSWVLCSLEDKDIKEVKDSVICAYGLREDERFLFSGNTQWFKKYSENKWLTYKILQRNNIAVPRQTRFRNPYFFSPQSGLRKKSTSPYVSPSFSKRFLSEIQGDIVIKPNNWWRWEGVFIIPQDIKWQCNLTAASHQNPVFLRISKYKGNYPVFLAQERIPSFPIEKDGVKKDWNLRVLVTYCPNKKTHIIAGITWRMDDDGGPVNRSISAENISFEEIAKLCNWDTNTFKKVKQEVEDISLASVNALVTAGERKWIRFSGLNFQDLAGVDIIINPDLKPYVLEVNDSNSGCVYELFKLEGIEPIKKIAQSIKYKVNTFLGLWNLAQEISKQFTPEEILAIENGTVELNVSC